MAARKGHKKAGGRAKGTPNKLTTTFKELVITTLDAIQKDPGVNLESWAKANPTEFYKIASKLIPTEISATIAGDNLMVYIPEKKKDTDNSLDAIP